MLEHYLSLIKRNSMPFTNHCFLARNEELGLKAVKQIHEINNEYKEKVRFYQLDITNVESIHRLADYIKNKYGGLDILINNAAILFKVKLKEYFYSTKTLLFLE